MDNEMPADAPKPDSLLGLCYRWLLQAVRNPKKRYNEEKYKLFEAKVRKLCARHGRSAGDLSNLLPYQTLENEEKNPPYPLGGEVCMSASVEDLVREAMELLGGGDSMDKLESLKE
jgi:hypothetical protein